MQRRIIVLIIVLGIAMPRILESHAADPVIVSGQGEPSLRSAPVGGTSLMTMSDAQAEGLSPLNREIRKLLLQERADVARLTASLESMWDPAAALAVHRQISDLKAGTQVAILEVQGRFARQEGRIELADEIDAAVARMKSRQEVRSSYRMGR